MALRKHPKSIKYILANGDESEWIKVYVMCFSDCLPTVQSENFSFDQMIFYCSLQTLEHFWRNKDLKEINFIPQVMSSSSCCSVRFFGESFA